MLHFILLKIILIEEMSQMADSALIYDKTSGDIAISIPSSNIMSCDRQEEWGERERRKEDKSKQRREKSEREEEEEEEEEETTSKKSDRDSNCVEEEEKEEKREEEEEEEEEEGLFTLRLRADLAYTHIHTQCRQQILITPY